MMRIMKKKTLTERKNKIWRKIFGVVCIVVGIPGLVLPLVQGVLLIVIGLYFLDVITKEHILKLISKQKELNFNPGDEYLYCNTGFTLLAEVVARVSGKSFAEFTDENIFKPLKMSNTLFYDDHEKIVKNRAYSYQSAGDGYKKSVLSYANVGATSLFTTVEDLSLWAMKDHHLTECIARISNVKCIRAISQIQQYQFLVVVSIANTQ